MTERGQVTLDVQGMTCGGCAAHVEKTLRGVAGVVRLGPSWEPNVVRAVDGSGLTNAGPLEYSTAVLPQSSGDSSVEIANLP